MDAWRGMIRHLVPGAVRSALRRRLRQATDGYLRWRDPARAEDLAPFLARLGVREGDVLFVHSSFEALRGGVEGLSPFEAIRILQHAVGPKGTLLMPTLPFDGSAVAYAAGDPVFDVRRTPSRTGLLTELFRRTAGVHRSVHPTHSAAAWGAQAVAMLAEHHTAATPCGRPSPHARLLDYDGRILLLGVGALSMTFLHTIDELLEARLPFAPFTREVYCLRSRDGDGTIVETRTRLFEQASNEARARFETSIEPRMRQRGTWRASRLGPLRGALVAARDVLRAAQELVA